MAKSKSYIVATIAMLALLVQSCYDGVAYDEFVALPDNAWDKDTLAIFRADLTDTTTTYDVAVMIRNDNNYPYANLWLFVDVVSPDGQMRRDTLECMLANPDGSWRGAGWGSIYTKRCPYMQNVRFRTAGAYTFRFTQGMRAESLEGLHDIGLLIERHDNGDNGQE